MNNELEIWNEGRRELIVTKLDDTRQPVIIKKVGMKHMPTLLSTLGDESARALCYLEGRYTPEWFDSLTPESQFDILEKGATINDPLFERWLRQRKAALAQMGVSLTDVVATTVANATAASASAAS